MEAKFDIDGEKIMFDGKWRSADDLKERITSKVNDGDFNVSEESEAIKELSKFIENLSEYTLKIPENVLKAAEESSDKSDITIGETIRKALAEYLE